MGFARLAEGSIRNARGIPAGERLSTLDRVAASALGGALGCWNQPIEVVRVEVRLHFHTIDSRRSLMSSSRCRTDAING